MGYNTKEFEAKLQKNNVSYENNLENIVTMLGEKANPYPYIKKADMLLISSVSEAAPMVIGESAFLGTPILSTRTSSAKEMIEEKGYGWVCENSVERSNARG